MEIHSKKKRENFVETVEEKASGCDVIEVLHDVIGFSFSLFIEGRLYDVTNVTLKKIFSIFA